MAQMQKENKMGVMPINKLLITMALPMIVSMLVMALYNIVDSIFVARICENALTAVSLAFPVQNLMIAIASGTGVGMNALLAQSSRSRQIMRRETVYFLRFAAICSFCCSVCSHAVCFSVRRRIIRKLLRTA